MSSKGRDRGQPAPASAKDGPEGTGNTRQWLIVFVKAPSPGQVKTRLLPVLSAEEAAQLYRCLVSDTLEVVNALPHVRVAIAYAANAQFPDLSWLAYQGPMFFQHGSTLGERLIHAFQWAFEQGAQSVIALGSDAPDLSSKWIQSACESLKRTEAVIGPTLDGGYHLIGLTEPHPELFTEMPWSSPQLFRRTLDRLEHVRLAVRCLEPVTDLDTPEDVRGYLATGARRSRHTARYLREIANTLVSSSAIDSRGTRVAHSQR